MSGKIQHNSTHNAPPLPGIARAALTVPQITRPDLVDGMVAHRVAGGAFFTPVILAQGPLHHHHCPHWRIFSRLSAVALLFQVAGSRCL